MIEEQKTMFFVSVPCRGTTFLNDLDKLGVNHNTVSVPCRGTTFLNGEAMVKQKEKDKPVSVPCRGTTFLNTILAIPPPARAHRQDCVGKYFHKNKT